MPLAQSSELPPPRPMIESTRLLCRMAPPGLQHVGVGVGSEVAELDGVPRRQPRATRAHAPDGRLSPAPGRQPASVRENPSSFAIRPADRAIHRRKHSNIRPDPQPTTLNLPICQSSNLPILQLASLTELMLKRSIRSAGALDRRNSSCSRGSARPERPVWRHLRKRGDRAHVPAEVVDGAFHLAALDRNTPSRVSPVTSAVCGSTVRMYQKQVTSSARSVCAIISRVDGPAPATTRLFTYGAQAVACFGGPISRRNQMLQDPVPHPLGSRQLQSVVEHRRCAARIDAIVRTASPRCPARRDPNRWSHRRKAVRRCCVPPPGLRDTGCAPRLRRASS